MKNINKVPSSSLILYLQLFIFTSSNDVTPNHLTKYFQWRTLNSRNVNTGFLWSERVFEARLRLCAKHGAPTDKKHYKFAPVYCISLLLYFQRRESIFPFTSLVCHMVLHERPTKPLRRPSAFMHKYTNQKYPCCF